MSGTWDPMQRSQIVPMCLPDLLAKSLLVPRPYLTPFYFGYPYYRIAMAHITPPLPRPQPSPPPNPTLIDRLTNVTRCTRNFICIIWTCTYFNKSLLDWTTRMLSNTSGDTTFCFLVMVLSTLEKLHSDMVLKDGIHKTECAARPMIGIVGTTCVANSSSST